MLKQKIRIQALVPEKDVKNRTEILPEKILTSQDSCLYVKKMLALAISNITYLRGLLKNDCFADRLFDDLPVKVLTNTSKSETLKNLKGWLQGAYEAIDKKYVSKKILHKSLFL